MAAAAPRVWRREVPTPVIGRCKRCERARKAAGERRPVVAMRWDCIRVEALRPDRFGVERWTWVDLLHASRTCPAGHQVYGVPIRGRLVEDAPCNAKCTGAFGPSCDCSCGGANHGAAHA